jgi:aspartate racemase
MKSIGILGGFGPQATMDLEAHIHRAAQRIIPPFANTGYPPMIVHYHRHPPILLREDHSPVLPLKPDPRLLEAAGKLGSMVDFLLIPSNGIHSLQYEIEKAAGCKILSMIDATMEEVRQKNWQRIGLLGFGKPNVYMERLQELKISFEILEDGIQQRLDNSIMKVMEGQDNSGDQETAKEAIDSLRSRGVDGIIPGCTELPLLLKEGMMANDLVNPVQLLAVAAVKYCIA